jgi:hypothetical protein
VDENEGSGVIAVIFIRNVVAAALTLLFFGPS